MVTKTELNDNYDKDKLILYEYPKPQYGISVIDFYKHCENGKNIDIDNL